MELETKITLNLQGLERFKAAVENGASTPAIGRMLTQWAARYRSSMQRRFIVNSKGGGEWPALSPYTLRRRGNTSNASILRDTGTLFAALSPAFSGQPGALQETNGWSVTVGFGGPATHPTGGHVTVADIAAFHNFGMGNNPVRRILWEVTPELEGQMASDAERALNKLAKDEIG